MTETESSVSQSRSLFDSDLDGSADVILRSTDGIDFRAHKIVLSIASPVFRDMFRIGENYTGVEEDGVEGPPVVPMTEENGEVVEKLLKLCYPGEFPVFETLDKLQQVLSATWKYQMERPAMAVRGSLLWSQFLDREPIRAFAIACRHGWEQEARKAAKASLREKMTGVPAALELKMITGFTLNRLIAYRTECTDSVISLTSDFKWVPHADWIWAVCRSCVGHGCVVVIGNMSKNVRQWWMDYVAAARAALGNHPCGKSVTGASVMHLSLQTANGCPKCAITSFLDLKTFSELLAAEVENKTSQVI